eukprot:Opistho-2@21541
MGFLRWLFGITLNMFFRDIEIVGADNIPASGPVIFVGNHNNQFVDALLLDQCVGSRKVRFLIAEKSFKRKLVGRFARWMESIPVSRAIDNASKGIGCISSQGGKIVGTGTSFVKQAALGDQIQIENINYKIKEIVSDTELHIDGEINPAFTDFSEWKVMKKIDQSAVYKNVHDTLAAGECIGIFPEGGSHDRTSLLPLKAGVALMALGAMEKHTGLPVQIVACGLNYFRGHRFRSRVLVEFTPAITIEDALVQQYKTDKRKATGELLARVEESLKSAVFNAPDYETMVMLHAARRMYTPADAQLSVDQYLKLTRRFAAAHSQLMENPEYQKLFEDLRVYYKDVRKQGLRDRDVAKMQKISRCNAFVGLCWRSVKIFFLTLLALPGFLLVLPIGLMANSVAAKKAVEAKAASDVKLKGLDVIATWKLMTALILCPLAYLFYVGTFAGVFGALSPLVDWLTAVIVIAVSLILPFWAYYSAVAMGEVSRVVIASKPLAFYAFHGDAGKSLQDRRKELAGRVRELVEVLGPQVVPNFDMDRIIKPGELMPMVHGRRSFLGDPSRKNGTEGGESSRDAHIDVELADAKRPILQ